MKKHGQKALAGRRILVTRPRGQSGELAGLLRRAGARVLALPAIRIGPPSSFRPMDAAARRLLDGGYSAVVFTSANGVKSFFERLRRAEPGLTARRAALASVRFAAIGPKTAEALKNRGVPAASCPSEHVGEALARSLRVRRGERLLLPQAAQARAVLARLLRKKGAKVDVVEAYRTSPDPAAARRLKAELLGGRPPDWITFSSVSTVESLCGLLSRPQWRGVFKRCRAAAIGPVTGRALLKTGVRPSALARPCTAKGLAEAIRCAT